MGHAGDGVQQREARRQHVGVQQGVQGRRVRPGGLGVQAGAVGLVQEGVQVESVEGVQVEQVSGGGGGCHGVRGRPQGQGQLWQAAQGVFHAHEGGAFTPKSLLSLPPLGATVLEPHLREERQRLGWGGGGGRAITPLLNNRTDPILSP